MGGALVTAMDQYVTRDELAARLAEFELRIVDRLDALAWRLIALILGVYALVIGTIVAVVFFGLNIISRLPAPPAS
jgi:hypothetical protein